MSTNNTPLQDRINRIESAAKYIYDHLITHGAPATDADRKSYAPHSGDAATMAELILFEVQAINDPSITAGEVPA